MGDIVDKLHDGSVCSPAQNYCRNNARMSEAADEIERLRAAVEAVHSWLVCAVISTPEEMAESFAEMEKVLRDVCPSMAEAKQK